MIDESTQSLDDPVGPRLERVALARIAAAMDGYPEGRDATVLAELIARATGAELMLVAVHPDPLIALPRELGWSGLREQAHELLREARAELAPDARITVVTDWSVPRALQRVVAREHRQLLVVGSSRQGPDGCVSIGKRTRQLLGHTTCALAVAPRGYAADSRRLATIGVGYDGGVESRAALAFAAGIAAAAGTRLVVRGVVDDRAPAVGWSDLSYELADEIWSELLQPEVEALHADASGVTESAAINAEIQVVRGAPAEVLVQLSAEVDLLIVGSRRWGATARVLLGSVGERLMREARCPVAVVPRPAD